MDSLQPACVLRSAVAARQAGGKGVNVSRVLAELNVASTAACLVGGPDAAVFQKLLRSAPFETRFLRTSQPTRTNITLRVQSALVSNRVAAASRRGSFPTSPPPPDPLLADALARHPAPPELYKINQPGPAVTPAEWRRLLPQFTALMAGRAWVVLAGALPPGLPASAYAELAAAARAAGARVALDCAGEPLRLALAAAPELVKPNREELAATVGGPVRTRAQVLRAMQRLQSAGAKNILVTAGAGECLLLSARGEAFIGRPPRIRAQGTVGAGDSLLAGLLAARAAGRPWAEALRLGLACGAATTLRPDPLLAEAATIAQLRPSCKTIKL